MATADWNIAVPANTDQISSGDDVIRDLKAQLEARQNKEHVNLANGGLGGEHAEGSAMVYYATAAASLTRPNGDPLTSADEGRIRFNSDDQLVRVYSGSTWVTAGYVQFGHASTQTLSGGQTGIDITNGTSASSVVVTNTSSGHCLELVTSNGKCIDIAATSTSSPMVDIDLLGSSNTSNAVDIELDSNCSGNGLIINQGGTGSHFNLSGDPANSSPSDGDVWFDGTDLKIRVGSTTSDVMAGKTATITSGGYADWQNDGTGAFLDITNSTNGVGINLDGGSHTTSIAQRIGSDGGFGLIIDTTSTGRAIDINDSGSGTLIDANRTGSASTPMTIFKNESSANGTTMRIHNNVGSHIQFEGDPSNTSGADGDFWFDGTNLKIRVGATIYTLDKTAV